MTNYKNFKDAAKGIQKEVEKITKKKSEEIKKKKKVKPVIGFIEPINQTLKETLAEAENLKQKDIKKLSK